MKKEKEKKKGRGGFEACQTDTLLLFYINNPTKAAFQQQVEYVTCMQSLCKNGNIKMEIKKFVYIKQSTFNDLLLFSVTVTTARSKHKMVDIFMYTILKFILHKV